MKPRYLSKSRFKLGHECPTKLYYKDRPKEYANQTLDDPFLQALADGGHQVGTLAQLYFPNGTLVETLDYDRALSETAALLKRDTVIIYEAAFRFDNLFLRADIVVKKGTRIELFEVKSTSYEEGEPFFQHKKPFLYSGWEPYLFDVAFQTYVMRKALPGFTVEPYLFLVNKGAKCPTDSLHQKLLLSKDQAGRVRVTVRGIVPDDLKGKLLYAVPVNDEVDRILAGSASESQHGEPLEKEIQRLAALYQTDALQQTPLSSACKNCEFTASSEELKAGLKSGLHECWMRAGGLTTETVVKPKIIDLWDFRKTKEMISRGTLLLEVLTEDDIASKTKKTEDETEAGLSRTERQWLQIKAAQTNSRKPFIAKEELAAEIKRLKYPLHFIDFETTAVAIPFHQGMRPYEGVAFQFSHHIMFEDGKIEHRGQFLHSERGCFPNFDFARALKRELENDQGSIFRYATHENTYLNFIINQLEVFGAPDGEELITFLKTVTEPTKAKSGSWVAPRPMVDMLKWVKKYYYHPDQGGSNSIKSVLPAILGASRYLQEKYSRPIYGMGCPIPSLNFEPHIWVKKDSSGKVIDPYKQLSPLFPDYEQSVQEQLLFQDEKIANGGAAMVAWARMQFTEMNDVERKAISESLLKYCELDTFAMVMIYEYWKHEIENKAGNAT